MIAACSLGPPLEAARKGGFFFSRSAGRTMRTARPVALRWRASIVPWCRTIARARDRKPSPSRLRTVTCCIHTVERLEDERKVLLRHAGSLIFDHDLIDASRRSARTCSCEPMGL